MLGKKGGVGGKPPSNSLLVIKMDAIYFFWHSNYIDVCRQLFALTQSVLSAAVSALTFDIISPKVWQGLGWRDHWLGSLTGELRASFPRKAKAGGTQSSDVPRVVPAGGGRGGVLLSLLSHTLLTFPPVPISKLLLSGHTLIHSSLHPSMLCVNENPESRA